MIKPNKDELVEVHNIRVTYSLPCNNCINYDWCKEHQLDKTNFNERIEKYYDTRR